jgi:hypothetical protein
MPPSDPPSPIPHPHIPYPPMQPLAPPSGTGFRLLEMLPGFFTSGGRGGALPLPPLPAPPPGPPPPPFALRPPPGLATGGGATGRRAAPPSARLCATSPARCSGAFMCLICFSSQLPEAKKTLTGGFLAPERRLQRREKRRKKKVPGACGVWSGVEKYSQGKKLDRPPVFGFWFCPLLGVPPGPRPRSCLR